MRNSPHASGTTAGIPGHDQGGQPPRPSEPRPKGGKRPKAAPQRSEVERALATMDTLPPLVVTKQITPAECNAVMGVLKVRLDHFGEKENKSAIDPAGNAVPAGLKDAVRERPDLLNFFTKCLSPEALAQLVDDDEPDDETDDDESRSDDPTHAHENDHGT